MKTVAEHDGAGGQGGTNRFAPQLRPAGVHQEQFGFRCHRVIGLAVFERVADFFANGRAARLPELLHGMALLVQTLRQNVELRRFPAPFCSFKRDEQSAHSFFKRAPLGVSSITQPLAFSSSRMASARLKSRALRAACRSSSKLCNSAGISAGSKRPRARTESIFSHAANAAAACGGSTSSKPNSRLFSRTHSKTAPQAPEILKSSSNAAENAASNPSSAVAVEPPAASRNLATHSSRRARATRAPRRPSSVKLNDSR